MESLSHIPRVVVAGYGRWGRHCHCQLIALSPNLELHGVVSSDADKRREAAAAYGCKTYSELHDALHDDAVDVVVLATPNSTHADLSVRALEHGKHVVTDKVMCLNVGECERMTSAAQRNDRVLTVFQNRRLDGDFLTVCSLVDGAELGDVRWVEMAWQGFGGWKGWRGRSDMGGGRIYDLGVHMLDQLLLMFPAPVASVYCRTHYDLPGSEVESEGLIVVTFADGRTGLIDVSALATISKPRFYVRGTGGSFVKYGLDPQEKALMEGNIDSAVEAEEFYGTLRTVDAERRVPTRPGRWRTYYDNLGEALCGRAQPLVSLEQARRVIEVIDAAKHSALTQDVIHLMR